MRKSEAKSKTRRLARVPRAAERLDLSVRKVWAMIAAGELTAYRFGRRATRVDLSEVEALIEAAGKKAG